MVGPHHSGPILGVEVTNTEWVLVRCEGEWISSAFMVDLWWQRRGLGLLRRAMAVVETGGSVVVNDGPVTESNGHEIDWGG